MNTVLITGVSGMDGSWLADKYLAKGWQVVGIDHWSPTGFSPNIHEAIKNERFILETGDISEHEWIVRMVKKYAPDIIYNMAAISLVPESFKIPHRIFDVNTKGVLNFLEAIREYSPATRFYQASTSEQFGENKDTPQTLKSNMLANSPYAISKLASFHLVRQYRTAYNLFCVNGLLYNHEGTRRGPNFVTRKITSAVARIQFGRQECVELGFLDSYRDWGDADDYTDAMILMMEKDEPDDYLVATGETHTIREFVIESFKCIGLKLKWTGKDMNEIATDQNGIVRVKINPKYFRPLEVYKLCGDAKETYKKLNWKPKIKFSNLVKKMIGHDILMESKIK